MISGLMARHPDNWVNPRGIDRDERSKEAGRKKGVGGGKGMFMRQSWKKRKDKEKCVVTEDPWSSDKSVV